MRPKSRPPKRAGQCADDSLLFFKGNLEQALNIKGMLSAYE